MRRWIVETMETCLRITTRIRGIGRFPEPSRYFGEGGVQEARALCREANADLPGFLRPPESCRPVEGIRVHEKSRGRSLAIREIRFPSPLPTGRPVSDEVQIRVLEHPSSGRSPSNEPRPVVVFHHPIYQRSLAPWSWFLGPLVRKVPVAVVSAPHHFGRTEPGEFPSESSLNPNPWRLFEAIRQWCHEQPQVHRVLEDVLGLQACAVVGYSFGAFQSILLSCARPLDLPLVTVASTNRYTWGVFHGVIGAGLRDGMRAVGIDEGLLSEMTSSLELERWAPALRGRPVLYVYGAWDRVDPPPSLARLEEALKPTRSVRIAGGHATLVLQRDGILSAVIDFLHRTAGIPG